MFRLTTLDFDVASGAWLRPDAVISLVEGVSVVVGREGDAPVAFDPVDTGVSRKALTVSVDREFWELEVTNSNHAWIHAWGQRPAWVESGSTVRRRWPRVGVLLIGGNQGIHHWVLLESDEYRSQRQDHPPMSTDPVTPGQTRVKGPADDLTRPQLEAVQTVFAKHLAWPPVVTAEPMLLNAAARRLGGVSQNAVSDRLKQAQARAYGLGPQRQVGVMNPEYVYILAGAGYLPVPDFHRLDI